MRLPKTMDEYQEMVEQALAEVEDLRQSAEFDENDEWGGVYRFLDSIEAELRHLHQSMVNGSYSFGDSDLPYMRFIANVDPFTCRSSRCWRPSTSRTNKAYRKTRSSGPGTPWSKGLIGN